MIAAGLTLMGFFALAAAMPRHAPALLGNALPRVRPGQLRRAGAGLLCAAFLAALLEPDWPLALVRWAGMLPLAAALVLLGLTYDVRLARAAAALGALAVVGGLLL
ncbi:DUF3325 family protein [Sphingomonas elodea]|uniref:DUF3325 family protein n=1 Tax=Sphingomonas elodea TaxID=179878 RepID=UPI00026308CF|nr:DUF3325 family protein [Sphingomonas elodea]